MRKMKIKHILINLTAVCLLLPFAFAAAGCSVSEKENNGKLNVACTIFPQYDMARIIGGDRINLSLLIKTGADNHNYEPIPSDIIAAGDSDIFITAGGINDIWIEKVLPSVSNQDIKIISLMDCIEAFEEEITEGMQEEEHDAHDNEPEYDEHVWTSPLNMIKIAEKICSVLSEADKENEAFYFENLKKLINELEKLDSDIRAVIDSSARKTLIFGDRFAFRYFTEEYGLDYYAAFPGCSTDTDASAATIAFLIDKVKSENIPVVYYLENGTEKIAEAICRETGAEALLLNSCHSAGENGMEIGYIGLMYGNLENLKKGLN